MKCINFENRKLCFSKIEEINNSYINDKYAFLIFSDTEKDIEEIKPFLESILNSNCLEVFCFGKVSSKLHDIIDDIIFDHKLKEDYTISNILTTNFSNKPIDDICFYFINLAGSKPPVLFAITNDNQELEMALEEYIKNKKYLD